jgi:hypothetical protein
VAQAGRQVRWVARQDGRRQRSAGRKEEAVNDFWSRELTVLDE